MLVGLISVDTLPSINVVQRAPRGHYFSLDNRRLWVLQQYRRYKEFKAKVCVLEWSPEFEKKFSTKNEGVSIEVRRVALPKQEAFDKGELVPTFQEKVLRWSLGDIKVHFAAFSR